MDVSLVVLRRYPARIHAELAKTALEASGIDSTIVGGDFSYRRGGPIELLVRAEDVQRAVEILGPEERFTI